MRVKIGERYRIADTSPVLEEFRGKLVMVLGEKDDFYFKDKYPVRVEVVSSGKVMVCREKHLKPIKNNIIKI